MRLLLLGALFALAQSNTFGAANACSQVQYTDDGRYVGGDLVTQIARKADTIQVVRATARHIFRRTYSEGDWYWRSGDTNVPDHFPDYIDEFVYELTVVETLKGGVRPALESLYDHRLRILSYGARELPESPGQRSAGPEGAPSPNALPAGLLERPGHDGLAFSGGAAQGASLGLGSCNGPYVIDIGQTFIAFRDSIGRLYPSMGAFPLAIDVEFRSQSGRQERFAFNMQSLVPVEGEADPFLTRLRQALATPPR